MLYTHQICFSTCQRKMETVALEGVTVALPESIGNRKTPTVVICIPQLCNILLSLKHFCYIIYVVMALYVLPCPSLKLVSQEKNHGSGKILIKRYVIVITGALGLLLPGRGSASGQEYA